MNQEEEIKNLKEHIVAMQSKINELAEQQNNVKDILGTFALFVTKVVKKVEQQ